VEANSTGGQGSRRAVAPSDDNDDDYDDDDQRKCILSDFYDIRCRIYLKHFSGKFEFRTKPLTGGYNLLKDVNESIHVLYIYIS
jgi:hypothetical protein